MVTPTTPTPAKLCRMCLDERGYYVGARWVECLACCPVATLQAEHRQLQDAHTKLLRLYGEAVIAHDNLRDAVFQAAQRYIKADQRARKWKNAAKIYRKYGLIVQAAAQGDYQPYWNLVGQQPPAPKKQKAKHKTRKRKGARK